MEVSEKPDFSKGIPIESIPEGGKLQGVVDGEDVLLVRSGTEFFAVGAFCTHYHGPLAEGLVVGKEVRCPWHHARFSLRTGEALRAPALDSIQCWKVVRQGDRVFVKEKASPLPVAPSRQQHPSSIVIVGGGGAGLAAADMLRRKGFAGPLTMISADSAPPCDRPNLSKDFLAGSAPDDWIPLRSPEWYSQSQIELILNSQATELDTKAKTVRTETGKNYKYDAILLATGADPVRIPVEGAEPSRVFFLRSFADSKSIIAKANQAKKVCVVGASFIGLEVAASLRARGIDVHVVAPDAIPMSKILGNEVGTFIRDLHESRGVVFHLGQTVKHVDGEKVTLSSGEIIEADFLVLGVGVRPSIALAQQAGLAIDRGVIVNEYLETSVPGVFAAGDAARWPDPLSEKQIRVEHWVVAERMGQTAAKNMLGMRERFEAVPFFWSQHYDVPINYVGHAEGWDSLEIDGDLSQRDCAIRYKDGGRTTASVTISRDVDSLRAELEMERVSREKSDLRLGPRSSLPRSA
jgi:NADPH-dependent 2,4-dienoyl-CoA reductase/sulfur reductase-like enzyme/nitrite reductase/ring-hydroxylating ferredoxin subunit